MPILQQEHRCSNVAQLANMKRHNPNRGLDGTLCASRRSLMLTLDWFANAVMA